MIEYECDICGCSCVRYMVEIQDKESPRTLLHQRYCESYWNEMEKSAELLSKSRREGRSFEKHSEKYRYNTVNGRCRLSGAACRWEAWSSTGVDCRKCNVPVVHALRDLTEDRR